MGYRFSSGWEKALPDERADERRDSSYFSPIETTKPLDESLAGKPVSNPKIKPDGCSVKYKSS
jgi:hypothetical protein